MNRLFLMLLVALCGCPSPRAGAPIEARIAVEEFQVPHDAVVERYSRPTDPLGMRFAQLLAERLTRIGYQAIAVPRGQPLQGDFNVTGRIAEIDGGNTAKRVLIGMGVGHSEFDVYGTVTRGNGTVVGQFTESRAGGGWGEQAAVEGAMQKTIHEIGLMIYTGHYLRNAPNGRPAAEAMKEPKAVAATASTTEERLRALERLRDDRAITAEEYAAKRRAILEAL